MATHFARRQLGILPPRSSSANDLKTLALLLGQQRTTRENLKVCSRYMLTPIVRYRLQPDSPDHADGSGNNHRRKLFNPELCAFANGENELSQVAR